ncbi:acetyltransferase (GNAT) family protein [Idiomarina loihiensis]|uniref:GNAT family N-acetyltransferase n=1 Tax=Idiomarina TaxID=135575 RepID=UPI000D713E2B|nr:MULTISPECIES: GNAT family N-acetyltransferase [Idiomarina]PWW34559.1 acetyltransferase (GNAT) family protein [Idiomarina loihiensis]TDP47689.1 acetyltransferase (GNAT) family protein [Idiomarina loihiensis]TDS23430.1 acetyltransferase (GNAT) family protein [Idiomarina sp. H2]
MKIEFQVIVNNEINDSVRKVVAEALYRQGKVQGNLSEKADRCKFLCIARINGEVVGIGAIKPKTKSDFSEQKADLSKLADDFNAELGYLHTNPAHARKGIARNIAKLLVDAYGKKNLMASTEVSANPGMVKILETLGFRHYGKPWKSVIHGNYLGLFLKFQ